MLSAMRRTTPLDRETFEISLVPLEGHRASKGVFVTTSTFAKSAMEYVDRVSKRVVLIDGKRLSSLVVEHGVGVRDALRS